jgi:hypothetical protein
VKNSTFLALTPKQVNSRTGLKCESHSHTGLKKTLKKSSFTKQEISIKCHGAIISEFGSKLDVGLTRFWVENILLKKNSSLSFNNGWDVADAVDSSQSCLSNMRALSAI